MSISESYKVGLAIAIGLFYLMQDCICSNIQRNMKFPTKVIRQLLRLYNLKIKLFTIVQKIREKHFLYLWVSSQAGIQMILKFLENHYIGKEMQFFLECSTFSETFFPKCPEVRMSDTNYALRYKK